MLNLLDRVIEKVLDSGWTPTPPPAKPGFFFTIPDDEWRNKVKSGTQVRLNIYLYEVRENVSLRRSQWDPIELADHSSILSRAPVYFDCHYLLSAWSPSEDSEALAPMLDEHQVLAEALRVIIRNLDVNPAVLGIAGGGPVFQQARVSLTVAQPEAPRVLNDFWSTMKLPWRPAIQLVATAPLDLLQDSPPAPPMTTFIQRLVQIGVAGGLDEWITLGGWVLNPDDTPIAGATVRHVTTGETMITDSEGRYVFAGLRRGTHTLRAEAAGKTPVQRNLNVPDGPPTDHIFKLS